MPNLTGDKFKVVLAEFSTLSLAVFVVVSVLRGIHKRTHLELKFRPRFHPISSSLSVVRFDLTAQWLHTNLVILRSMVQILAEKKLQKRMFVAGGVKFKFRLLRFERRKEIES